MNHPSKSSFSGMLSLFRICQRFNFIVDSFGGIEEPWIHNLVNGNRKMRQRHPILSSLISSFYVDPCQQYHHATSGTLKCSPWLSVTFSFSTYEAVKGIS